MNKGVLYSIQPQHCDNILKLLKEWEIRKVKPSIEPPFTGYIYCTKEKSINNVFLIYGGGKYACFGDYRNAYTCDADGKVDCYIGNGKIIGEFVCDKIVELESEFWDDETYESIGVVRYDEEAEEKEKFVFASNGEENWLCQKACLKWEELRKYIGQGINTFYALHISQLKIYEAPKELREFYKPIKYDNVCGANVVHCGHYQGLETVDYCEYNDGDCSLKGCKELRKLYQIKRPPQSWCYVEVDND
ncbi:MAG: hypothetical protein IKA02_02625 [Clostridia bacterium]|nr:hypothetical protein [Clostridia bacterium]